MGAPLAVAQRDPRLLMLPAVPPLPTAGSRARAWSIAFAVHLMVLALALWAPTAQTAESPPMVRLVFVEPPPPPPPPAGVPSGTGQAAVLPIPEVADLPVRPVAKQRNAASKKKDAPKPVAVARQRRAVTAPVVSTDPKAGSAAGTANGVTGGVAGGVPGGTLGGVVGGQGAGPLPAGQVAHPPTLVRRVTPEYPRAARQRGIEGLVVLEAILDTKGQVNEEIKVLQSVPDLDQAAIAALRQWRFKPARNDAGTSVAVILEVPIRFVLR